MRFSLDRLMELGLLRKIPKSRLKAEESTNTAESWLIEAENNLKNGTFRSCILSSYLAMFHSARAILFADGFREKSHFAVARYLEDRYIGRGLVEEKWINLLDHYREIRHEDQYSTSFFVTEEEAKNSLQSAQEFVERMKKLLSAVTKS